MNHSFEGLGLEPRIVATLEARGYTQPTPIQAALIPVLLEGKDAIGKAPTGTGKTAAFSLPIIQRLEAKDNHVQVLVLAPTRELAIQVAETMSDYGKSSGIKVLAIYGGQAYGLQTSKLRRGVDVVVGTPGRLLDLCEKRALNLSQVSTVILDEADEMLSMGFIEDIENLLDQTPAERQTVLMSATMPSRIRNLAKRYLRDAVACSIDADKKAPLVRQRAYLVNRFDKVAAISRIFEVEEVQSCLIFAKTQLGTEDLATQLIKRGIDAKPLHGGMSQDVRTRIIKSFKSGALKVLVGTDVAARGLDIDDVSHVINYELPADPEVYVHRIGRTGRAGRSGEAITIVAPNEIGRIRGVERFTGVQMDRPELPTEEEIETLRSVKITEKMGAWIERGRCHAERAIIQEMVDEGGDALEIAAAALRMARRAEYERPIEKISTVERRRPVRSESRNGNYASRSSSDSRSSDSRSSGDRSYDKSSSSSRPTSRTSDARPAGRTSDVRPAGRTSDARSAGGRSSDARPASGDYSKGRPAGSSTPARGSHDGRTGANIDGRSKAPEMGAAREKRMAARGGADHVSVKRPERAGAMVKLALSVGKESGIRVNNVVSTLARHGGIESDSIGRVQIDDGKTFVDVRESDAKQLLGKSGELRFGPQRLDVNLA
ncbi:MAG: ATP-dependent RNA helicase DeaD [Rhodothermales bacterium]|jgi:ATP-dependent RNA helicase DeaD